MTRQRTSYLPAWLTVASSLCYMSLGIYPWLLIFDALTFSVWHILALTAWLVIPIWIKAAHTEEV